MVYVRYQLESRLPIPGFDSDWAPVYSWPNDDEMNEIRAHELLEIYRRAMPDKQFRLREIEYDPDRSDDDIPF